jgi:hypothetical protein
LSIDWVCNRTRATLCAAKARARGVEWPAHALWEVSTRDLNATCNRICVLLWQVSSNCWRVIQVLEQRLVQGCLWKVMCCSNVTRLTEGKLPSSGLARAFRPYAPGLCTMLLRHVHGSLWLHV